MNIFGLDPHSAKPLYRQLYQELRSAVLEKRLVAGQRLPSTRALASQLKISRNTVLNAYEQLIAEGCIYGKIGSGNYVANISVAPATQESKTRKRILSKRGKILAETMVSLPSKHGAKFSFRPGTPALEMFPFPLWGKLLSRSLRRLRARDFHYGDAQGYLPLREAIAAYLNRSRGARCQADRVLIVSGSQQALDLCCRVFLDAADTVWMEDPGYKGARAALKTSGARVISVPIDEEGLQWKAIKNSQAPRCIYITPSHQFPLGITMSLQRRLALLEFAQKQKAWIIEDDYDSEFRYDGRPLAALQGLDQNDRVLYMGTFSKVMFAGLRLGYLIVPSDLVGAFANAKAVADRHSPILEQAALAEFISSGRFERHIREMRRVYARRQKQLVDSVNYFLRKDLQLQPGSAGMHLIGWLRKGLSDKAVSREAALHGIEVPALSFYSERELERDGLLLGYSALPPNRIVQGIEALANVIGGL
ncbi:PLP-dependent aminotransferase family protein [bacterium]|nr:PLP-dependent aminotransferase family protein [bacterium]MCI0603114.1 PLP-dependent aminotransferase family protein [bacterium]